MKKIIALLIAISVLSGVFYASALGDIDGDGSVTVSDALASMRIAAGLASYSAEADVDADGSVTVTDALQILRCALGFIKADGLSGDYDFDVELTAKAQSIGLTQEMVDRAVVSKGNTAKLVNVMRNAKAGKDTTIAFIGGSVTYGGAATTEYTRWARVVESWWLNTFADTKINYINAGYSGTPSLFGVHRVEEDVLSENPDLVVIEFGVNDELQAWQKEAYASLVRRVLTDDSAPAVMLLFVMNNGGTNAQADQAPIGEFYDLPMISYRDAIWPEVQKGTFIWTDICADWVHPTDKGHALVGQLINCYLQGVYDNLDKLSAEIKPVRDDLPLPYVYKNTEWLRPNNTKVITMGGFKASSSRWTCKASDSDPLIFRFYGSRLIIPILSDEGKTITAGVIVDGGAPVMLDSSSLLINSGQYAYYRVFDSSAPAWHTVEISVLGGSMTSIGFFASWQ